MPIDTTTPRWIDRYDPVTGEPLPHRRIGPLPVTTDPVWDESALPTVSRQHVYANSPEFRQLIRKAQQSPDSLTSEEKARLEKAISGGIIPDIFAQPDTDKTETALQPLSDVFSDTVQAVSENQHKPFLGELAGYVQDFGQSLDNVVSRGTLKPAGAPEDLNRALQESWPHFFKPLGPEAEGWAWDGTQGTFIKRQLTESERFVRNLVRGAFRIAPELLAAGIESPYDLAKGFVQFPLEEAALISRAWNIQWTAAGPEIGMYSSKEVEEAAEELRQNPLGMIFLGLMGMGTIGRIARRGTKRSKYIIREEDSLLEDLRKVEPKEPVERGKVKLPEMTAKEAKILEPWKMTFSEFRERGGAFEEPSVYETIARNEGQTAANTVRSLHQRQVPTIETHATESTIAIRGIFSPENLQTLKANPKIKVERYPHEFPGSPQSYTISGKPQDVVASVKTIKPQSGYLAEKVERALTIEEATELRGEIEAGELQLHQLHIEDAIKKGKPVPAEVLKDYRKEVKIAKEKAPKEAAKPAVAEEVPVPKREIPIPAEKIVREEIKPVEGEAVGLKKTEIARIREALDLNELAPPKRKAFERSMAEAREAKLDVTALETADVITRSQRPVTAAEHAGMVSKAVDLIKEYNDRLKTNSELIESGALADAGFERARIDAIRFDLDKLTEASERFGGTETARALSIRRMMRNLEDNSPAGVVQRARSIKGEKLTAEETNQFEGLAQDYADIKKTLEEVEAKLADSEIERNRLLADRITTRETKKARITEKAKTERELIFAERADIKKAIEALGYRVNDVTGVTAEGAYLVGKLAVNYIRGGAVTLEEVVGRVLIDLPDLTPNDVYQSLISREPKAQRRARTDTQKRIAQLKKQAGLLVEIEKAEKGIFEKAKEKQPQPAEIKSLQKRLRDLRTQAYQTVSESGRLERAVRTINELQDQLDNQHRSIRKKRPLESEELATAKEKIVDLRRQMKVEDDLANLNEQLRTGEFEVRQRPEPKQLPPEIERKQVELQMARRKIRTALQELLPITPRRVLAETVTTLRTAKATADLSGTLRQGFMLIATRPTALPKVYGKSLQAMFSEFKAEQIDHAIRSAEHHYIREKARLDLTEFGGEMTRREEMFMSNWIEKVPVVATIVKASNRHMTTFLNLMRTAAFDQYLEAHPNATLAELKGWADSINKFSGRGNLGRAAAIEPELSLAFFAPRFAISRLQTPRAVFKHWKEPRVRKEIAKTYVKTAALGGTVLGLAHLAGLEVGLDPSDPDWGKIRIGDTRIDVWAGLQQPVRLITRLGLAATNVVGLTGKDLSEQEKQVDPVELVGRYAAFKLGPGVTLPRELLTGKTAVGEEVSASETAIRQITPLVYEDIYEAWQKEGFNRALLVAPLGIHGVSVTTYEDSEAAVRGDIRHLFREGNLVGAIQKRLEWNLKHPDRKISEEFITRPADMTAEERKIKELVREGKLGEAKKRQDEWNQKHPGYKIDVK